MFAWWIRKPSPDTAVSILNRVIITKPFLHGLLFTSFQSLLDMYYLLLSDMTVSSARLFRHKFFEIPINTSEDRLRREGEIVVTGLPTKGLKKSYIQTVYLSLSDESDDLRGSAPILYRFFFEESTRGED